jgi:hypothetical protein
MSTTKYVNKVKAPIRVTLSNGKQLYINKDETVGGVTKKIVNVEKFVYQQTAMGKPVITCRPVNFDITSVGHITVMPKTLGSTNCPL